MLPDPEAIARDFGKRLAEGEFLVPDPMQEKWFQKLISERKNLILALLDAFHLPKRDLLIHLILEAAQQDSYNMSSEEIKENYRYEQIIAKAYEQAGGQMSCSKYTNNKWPSRQIIITSLAKSIPSLQNFAEQVPELVGVK